MTKPMRRAKKSGQPACTMYRSVSIFVAGLFGGAVLTSIWTSDNDPSYFLYSANTGANLIKNCVIDSSFETAPDTRNNYITETTINNSNDKKKNWNAMDNKIHLCEENPYRQSLLPGHTFETAETKAQFWIKNKTAVRDDLYFRYNGQHVHGKFDAFQVMAPCDYKCTGICRSDTSKIVCNSEKLIQPGCVVYSIGGNNNWKFEEEIYALTSCEIHTFDCTGPIQRFHPPVKIKDRHFFHHVCLSTENIPFVSYPEQVKHIPPDFSVVGAMETLQRMQKRLNHTRLDLLKMDIEGFEWPIFNSWPELTDQQQSDTSVILPMQILVEVHYRTAMHELWPQKGVIFKTEVDLVELQSHLLRMGYVVAVRDDNESCKHCTELTLLRHKCV